MLLENYEIYYVNKYKYIEFFIIVAVKKFKKEKPTGVRFQRQRHSEKYIYNFFHNFPIQNEIYTNIILTTDIILTTNINHTTK